MPLAAVAGGSSGSGTANGAAPPVAAGGKIGRRANRDPRAVLLDRHLADPRLLDDPHELPDALGAVLVDRRLGVVSPATPADAAQQPLCVLAEQAEQQ